MIAQQTCVPLVNVKFEKVLSKWYGEDERNLAGEPKKTKTTACLFLIDQDQQPEQLGSSARDLPAQSSRAQSSQATSACCRRCPAEVLQLCEGFPAGAIVFLDELDSLMTSRWAQLLPGSDVCLRLAHTRAVGCEVRARSQL